MIDAQCKHRRDNVCVLGLHGGRPSFGVCLRACDQYDGPNRGRGDLYHKLSKAATLGLVEPCNGCKKRRVTQNVKHPSKVLAGVAE